MRLQILRQYWIWLLLGVLLPSHSLYAQSLIINNIEISGNKITKGFIILRELPFALNDTLDTASFDQLLVKAKENLSNTSLFNFVTITPQASPSDDSLIDLSINVEERWYIMPLIEVQLEDRNFSAWLQELDFKRITLEVGARVDNFLGLRHKLVFSGSFGYQWGGFLGYRDIALDRNHKHYMGISVSANASHHLDVSTVNDKPRRENIPDVMLKTEVESRVNYYYRPNIRTTHNVAFYHVYTQLADTVLRMNPHYWGSDNTLRNAFRLNYWYTHDERDYHPYPLSGYYVRTGLNTYLTSDAALRYAQLTLNLQYFRPLSTRWFVSTAFSGGLSAKNQPAYILDRAIGYDNVMLRGYEYTIADGQAYAVSNNTLKYNLLKTKVYTLGWLQWLPKFSKIPIAVYSNLHVDMGYAHNKYHANNTQNNTLSNQLLWAAGVGLDVVTYYDLVIGVDYSFTKQTVLKKEDGGWGGIYFSIKVPFI